MNELTIKELVPELNPAQIKMLISKIASAFHNNVHADKLHDTMAGEKINCVNCVSTWLGAL